MGVNAKKVKNARGVIVKSNESSQLGHLDKNQYPIIFSWGYNFFLEKPILTDQIKTSNRSNQIHLTIHHSSFIKTFKIFILSSEYLKKKKQHKQPNEINCI